MSLADVREGLGRSAGKDLEVSAAGPLVVTVRLGQRHQRVRVSEVGEWLRLESRIGSASTVKTSVGELAREVLGNNDGHEFIALARDEDDWFVGRLDLPRDTAITEVRGLLVRLARHCDWLEERLVGTDQW